MMTQKISLLYFGSGYKAGLTTALTEQILAIRKLPEIDLTVISSENEMEAGLHQKVQNAGVDKRIIPHLDVHENVSLLASEIAKIINEKQIDVVNVHNNWQLALIVWLRWHRMAHHKFKTVYTIHGYRHNSPWKSFFAIGAIGTALFFFADRVISMSSYVSKKFFFLRHKTDQVYYVMQDESFCKEENRIDCDGLRLVFPAQFRHGKNQHLLIPVIREYVRKTQDHSIRVYLPGEGETRETCIKMVQAAGLEKNILFPGKMPHDQVVQLYEKCNVGLVLTNIETYGRCIAEPFALGRCVVTRRTGIAEDVIRHGVNGYLFDRFAELLEILIQLHNAPQRIVEAGNQAFIDKKILSEECVMQSYLNVLKKCVR